MFDGKLADAYPRSIRPEPGLIRVSASRPGCSVGHLEVTNCPAGRPPLMPYAFQCVLCRRCHGASVLPIVKQERGWSGALPAFETLFQTLSSKRWSNGVGDP